MHLRVGIAACGLALDFAKAVGCHALASVEGGGRWQLMRLGILIALA